MKGDIRKISVGKNYPDGAIHYQVGKTVRLQSVPYEIASIKTATEKQYENKAAYHIFIKNDEGTVYWKTVVDMPVIIENNIDFE